MYVKNSKGYVFSICVYLRALVDLFFAVLFLNSPIGCVGQSGMMCTSHYRCHDCVEYIEVIVVYATLKLVFGAANIVVDATARAKTARERRVESFGDVSFDEPAADVH